MWLGDKKLDGKLDGTCLVEDSHGLIYTTAAVLPGVATCLYVFCVKVNWFVFLIPLAAVETGITHASQVNIELPMFVRHNRIMLATCSKEYR